MSTFRVENFPFEDKRRHVSGERLKSAREEKRYSQQSAADEIGVDRTTLGKWERGDSPAPVEDYIKLSALYEVNPIHLMALDIVATEENIQALTEDILGLEHTASAVGNMDIAKGQSDALLRASLKMIQTYLDMNDPDD